jgi:hypothetical protein
MLNYILCWLRDFIKNKKLLLGAIVLYVGMLIANVAGLLPADTGLCVLLVGILGTIVYTMCFFSLKRTIVVKIIYGLAMTIASVFIVLAVFDILGVIQLPASIIKRF